MKLVPEMLRPTRQPSPVNKLCKILTGLTKVGGGRDYS